MEAETFHHIGSGAACGAEFAAAIGQHVERRDPLRDHERVVAWHQDNREANLDRARALRQRGQEHLRARGVANLGEEVLFGQPEVTETSLFRGHHVVEVLPIHVALGVLDPRSGHLKLIDRPNFIAVRNLSAAAIAGRTRAIRKTSIDASRHASPLAMKASR